MLRSVIRWRAAFGLALIAATALASPASAAPDPDDAVLLDVRLNQYKLGEGVRGYSTPAGVCVDLGDAILALDLPIRLDKQSRRATGWAFDERHTVAVDRASGQEHIMNNNRKVALDDIVDTPEGWCVKTTALSRWLGVELAPDLANALLVVRSDHKLAPQLAAERRARVSSQRVTFDLASLPHASAPYRFRAPAVDVVASVAAVRDKVAGDRIDARYELYASGEAGPVAYDARLSSDRHGAPQSLRVRAYRADPEARVLGPLRATYAAAGDVTTISTPLVAQSTIGRGAVVTNRPLDRPDTFDRASFRGELPNGWDAELYRNGQLLAFANDRADGRYDFRDVPLLYGQNRIEVVLYGPQGQIRREVKLVPVGLDSIPPKATFYWAGVAQDGHDLIELGRSNAVFRRGWRASAGIERGLDRRTSIAALVHSLVLESDRGRASYLEASVRRAVGPALVELSGSRRIEGGQAFRAQGLAELGRTHLGFETIWAAGGFESDRVLHDVTSLHGFTLDHSFIRRRSAIPVHLDARYTTRRDGTTTLEGTGRVSASLRSVSFTGELSWEHETRSTGPPAPDRIETGLLASGRLGKLRVRGEARYRLSPETEFQSATLVGEWSAGGGLLHPDEWRAEVGYDRSLHRGRAGLGYVKRFDRLALTATGEAATDGSLAAGLNVAFSIGPDPRHGGGVRFSADKLAAQGSTLVRVYRDVNANGIRDAGEPAEKDVQVSAGTVPVDRLTDGAGEVMVDGLEPFRPLLVGIDGSTMPDPFVQPSTSGLVVTPRPGVTLPIELPVVPAGDVDGMLVRDGGGGLAGVDLELIDGTSRVIARAGSDYDGFFLFERVPYGRYSLGITALSAQMLKTASALVGEVIVGTRAPSVHIGAIAAAPAKRVAAK